MRVNDHTDLIELKPHGMEGFLSAYVLRGHRIAIIDPGPAASVGSLIDELGALGVELEDVAHVAATHIHIDHAGGAGKLLKQLPNAKLLVHERGAPHMIDPSRLWASVRRVMGERAEMYGEVEPAPSDRVTAATEGMTVDLGGGVKFEAVETLGHASHALSFYEEKSRGVFVGDAAGMYVMSHDVTLPTTPPPFFLESALESLDRLWALRPEAIYYAHFGFTSQRKRLRCHGHQLTLWAGVIAEAAEEGLGVPEIYERLKEEDEMVKAAEEVLERSPLYRENVLLSIHGFLDRLRRAG